MAKDLRTGKTIFSQATRTSAAAVSLKGASEAKQRSRDGYVDDSFNRTQNLSLDQTRLDPYERSSKGVLQHTLMDRFKVADH